MPAAKKKTAAPVARPAVASAFGMPSERLQKLLVDANAPEPYEVTDEIVIRPMGKKRRTALREAHVRLAGHQMKLDVAIRRYSAPYPQCPQCPVAPGSDATAEQIAAYESALAQWEKSIPLWEKNIADWEAQMAGGEAETKQLHADIQATGDEYTQALFGDAYDDVIAYFDQEDVPIELWDAFTVDVNEHFGLTPKPGQLPVDGVCPTCGNVEDQEEAGKAPASSTSSKTTGTK